MVFVLGDGKMDGGRGRDTHVRWELDGPQKACASLNAQYVPLGPCSV